MVPTSSPPWPMELLMTVADLQDGATMRVLPHMIIYIKLVLWNNKSIPAMIAIDTLLRAQEGTTSKVPSYMNHHLGMLRIVIDTSHLMFAINQHLPRIFDDTPQDMVMMQEDENLDMKRPRLQRTTTPTIGCP